MRRILNVVTDVLDGVLAAVLYGRQGGLPSTLHDLEHLNGSKLRKWSAGSAPAETDAPTSATDDIDARIRAFRTRATKIDK
jgi:hypothetical protein